MLKTQDEIDIHACCSSALSTEYKGKQCFEENFPYVHPQPIFGGGEFDENRKEQYAQYLPIKHTLEALLKDAGMLEQGSTSRNESAPHILNDASDLRSVFKSNLFILSQVSL